MQLDPTQSAAWLTPLLQQNLGWVLPEVVLILAMCAVILVPFLTPRRGPVTAVATLGLGVALLATLWTMCPLGGGRFSGHAVFAQMLTVDFFSQFFKVLLLAFSLLIVAQWALVGQGRVSDPDVPDFLCLLLGATAGMALMASADNLLMIFLATETASLPSFALAGFRQRQLQSTEAALKYVLFGAVASAVSIYGMSLIYGAAGTLQVAAVATHAAAEGGMSPLLALGLLGMLAGFAFKLSAVPLHFWAPDVFEGAPIEVTTFLSVASKGAAVIMLVRLLHHFGAAGEFYGLVTGVAILGGVTCTWGNLVAFHQNNIKRLLAYSSIAHAGYMTLAASVAAALDEPHTLASAILFYLVVYTFMNLGAFTVAGLIARRTGSEDLRDYAGMSRRAPGLAGLMVLFLLSLFGMPGLGGFMGKIYLLAALRDLGGLPGMALVVVLLLNTLISLYYYLRPAYFMYFVRDERQRPAVPASGGVWVLTVGCLVMLLITGVLPGLLMNRTASSQPFAPETVTAEPAQASVAHRLGLETSGDR